MPNHIHGILRIAPEDAEAVRELPLRATRAQRRSMLLPKVVSYFKMNTGTHQPPA
jgi:hypothetical protein